MSDLPTQWQKEERRRSWSRILRWGFGVSLIVLPIPLLRGTGAIAIVAPLMVLLGLILIVPEILSWISQAAGSILWSHREGEIIPMYGIPESLVAKGKYAEAEAEYEKIIQAYPNEVKPHIDMIGLAVHWMHDGELAQRLFERGMSLLQRPEDRQVLTEAYERIQTRLKTPEDAKTKIISSEKFDAARIQAEEDRRKFFSKRWR